MIHESTGNWSKNLRMNITMMIQVIKFPVIHGYPSLLKLFSVKSQFQRLNTDFEKRLGDGKDKSFSELDFKITEKEVMQAIVKLKSAGLIGVKYEMLKCGQSSLTPCIVKLFNHILSSGQYPKGWKNSYIKPLYKGDDPLNPPNYRGISIMSCMSKLFSSVLNNRLQTFFDKN